MGKVFILLAVVSSLFPVFAERSSARAIVEDGLTKAGIQLVGDSDEKGRVFVGCHEGEVDRSLVMANRESFFLQAVLKAKHDLMRERYVKLSASHSVERQDDGEKRMVLTKSMCKCLSEIQMHGSVVIDSAESYDEEHGVYEVAVAVAWSEKLEAEGLKAANRGLPKGTVVEIDPEWEKELRKKDLSRLFGSRAFVDGAGRHRFYGVGAADVEGLNPLKRRNAMRLANMLAKRNLAFALYSDAAMKDVAVSIYARMTSGELTETRAWEEFVSQVSNRSAKIFQGHEVFSSDQVVHPLTGHRLYVSVCGVEPE